MSETNEIRKAIMERLGSVAKFSTTHEDLIAELRRLTEGKHTGEWHTIANTWLSRKRATGNREIATEANRAYDFVEREMLARMKQRASRPGAKAKFADDAKEVAQEILRQLGGGRFMAMVGGKNAMHGNFGGKPGLQVSIGRGAKDGINRLIVTLDRGSDTYDMEFWRIGNRGLSTKKVAEASGVYADSLQRVFTSKTDFYTSMSRPGAKAKMAITKEQIRGASREELRAIEQRLMALAKSGDKNADALLDYVEQEYNDRYRGTHSRPGAKAKMARGYDDPNRIVDDLTPEQRALEGKYSTAMYKIAAKAAVLASDMKHIAELAEKYNKIISYDGIVTAENKRRMDDLLSTVKPYMKIPFSRPGAKAKFAESVTYSVAVHIGHEPAGERTTKSLEEAKAYAKAMLQTAKANAKGKPVVVDVYPVVNYEPKPAVLTLRASRPGAKSTHAADEAVSKKIALLMDEGYPQDQAVAIALDMKRKGKI